MLPASLDRQIGQRLRPLVHLEPGEAGAALWSFVYFFAVLTAYYIVRPVRDELGVRLGPDALKDVFGIVFLVMLAAVPLFGWVVTAFSRRRTVPIVYLFFALNLVGYWTLLHDGNESHAVAKSFFVWVSVFNLFVVSLFWSVMASVWSGGQAKRLFGIIAAGGTSGAMAGPLLAQSLVHALGPANLLLISAAFLCLALVAAARLATLVHDGAGADAHETARPPVTLASVCEGAVKVWQSPYLFRIAVWVLLANLISTYFYFEQARILGATISVRAERVQLLARMDLAVSVLTVLAQLFLTARVIAWAGLGLATAALPLSAIVSFGALAATPALVTIVIVIVAERTIHFAFTNPAARTLYTAVEPEEKFKAQNFVDTVVFRGGDAASGWYFDWLKSWGLGIAGVAAVTLPLAAAWVWLSFTLARMFEARGSKAE